MELQKGIIDDLAPLYLSGDCSPESKAAVEEYFSKNPAYAAEMKALYESPIHKDPGSGLNTSDEINTLNRTKRLMKRKTYFLAFAIFFTLAPFSFVYSDGIFRWLVLGSPATVIVYFTAALLCWIGYFVIKRKI